MDFKDYCISQELTVRDALKRIDGVVPKIVFITCDGKLLESLTDGDVRRFLLSGGSLTDSALEAGNSNPVCAHDEAEAMRHYHQRNYVAIPIIDDERNLLDLYIGPKSDEGKVAELNLPVVINAGGKGTRLEPYTKILPKPLIPVGELPIIEIIMQSFQKYGCDLFSIIVNYKKEIMKAYFADNEQKYNITWYDEEKPLGTGGGLCYLKGKLDRTFIFTNCDSLLLINYASVLKFHRKNRNAITMICAYKNITIPYGIIDMGVNGSIESMREKPEFSFLTNTGVYVVEPEVLDDIEDNVSIGFPDIVERLRVKGKNVAIFPISENDWLDMGQLSELEKMRKRLYGNEG